MKSHAFFGKLFKSDASEGTRKKYQDRVDAINALEPSMQALSDDQLRAKTGEFKQRVQRGESLDALLPEAFAVRAAAPTAARRTQHAAAQTGRLRPHDAHCACMQARRALGRTPFERRAHSPPAAWRRL